MAWFRGPSILAALALVATSSVVAQQRPAPPAAPRLYVFDHGKLTGLDPKMFGFTREEISQVHRVNCAA